MSVHKVHLHKFKKLATIYLSSPLQRNGIRNGQQKKIWEIPNFFFISQHSPKQSIGQKGIA